MRLISCEHQGRRHWGMVEGSSALLCPDAATELPADLLGVIDQGLERLPELVATLRHQPSTQRVALTQVQLLAPLPRPRKNIICLGLNYSAHARESQQAKGLAAELPAHPVVFTKAVTAVTGPYTDIPLDSEVTTQLDWEVELAVVIGRGGRKIAAADALQHVFGYTVVNDLTARDLQQRHKQFFLGKSLDHGCPMGPWLVTADEITDPQQLAIECRVNGQIKQVARTDQQLFGVARIISLLSQSMTLEPGDVIATGTPEGVGFARRPPEFLQPGDVVESTVEAIGTLRNRVVAA